jgi:serine/threonine protein kinase/class 3 adenylate cyclase
VANTPPTGTVTFLFTDIEGSTKLWEQHPNRMRQVLERHNEILRSAVEDHNGYVFKTVGDAFCATFSHPREALRAALAAQQALFSERWSKPVKRLRVRMALHTGYAELERDGDYFGPAVNRVARLINLAYGGQVLLSGTTYDQVCDHPTLVDEKMQLVELGEHYLKDLPRPERISQVTVSGLLERFSPPLRDETPEEEERYRIKHFLGSGGFAKVYVAHDEKLEQDVAYKVLHPWHADNEVFVERFKREARNVAKLRSHPNVVPVYDRGEQEDGTYYMVMEYLPGGTLEDLIEREGALPAFRASEITLQIARALSEAHKQGVIHRDIKPENVLLTTWGTVKVGDFGIAKAAEAATKLTRTGFNPGTVHYMSPELFRGEAASSRSDLYSLGVVLYKMLAGKLPFEGESQSEIQNKHLHEQVPPLKEVKPDVPKELEAVCVGLLAKDPKDRYQDASELIEDLERVMQGHSPVFAARQQTTISDVTVDAFYQKATVSTPSEEEVRSPEEKDAISEDSGPSTVRVPDLVGKNVFEASSILADAGLKLGEQEEIADEEAPEDEILRQAPRAGTGVELGSLISVTVNARSEDRAVASNAPMESPGQARRTPARTTGSPKASQKTLIEEGSRAQVEPNEVGRSDKRTGLLIGSGVVLILLLGLVALLLITSRGGPGSGSESDAESEAKAASSLVFEDDFSSTSSGWPRAEYDSGAVIDYADGGYRIYDPPPDGTTLVLADAGTLEDMEVEVDATRANGARDEGGAWWGVTCRVRDQENYYRMWVDNDGGYGITKLEDGRTNDLTKGNSGNTVREGEATNRIRGSCVGSTLTLYVNDQKLVEAEDGEFDSGDVGLFVTEALTDELGGTDVSFDNFSVTKP